VQVDIETIQVNGAAIADFGDDPADGCIVAISTTEGNIWIIDHCISGMLEFRYLGLSTRTYKL
jgi:hypothetical protein